MTSSLYFKFCITKTLVPYVTLFFTSCGGLVAFDHLSGAIRAPWMVKLWVKMIFRQKIG